MILEESETSDSRQKETHIRTLRKELDHLLRRKGLKVKARAGNLKSVWLPNDVLEAKALPAAYEIVSQGSEVSHTTKGSAEIREETESRIGPILLYVRQLTSLTTLTLDKPGTLTLYKPPDIWLPFLKQEVKQATLELFFATFVGMHQN